MTAVAASSVAISAIEASGVALDKLAASPLAKTTTVNTNTSYGQKIAGNVFVISINQTVSGSDSRYFYLGYTTVGDAEITVKCNACYSTDKAIRRFFDGLNMKNSYTSDWNVSVKYIDC